MSKKAIHWSGVFPAVSTQFRSDYSTDLDATHTVMKTRSRMVFLVWWCAAAWGEHLSDHAGKAADHRGSERCCGRSDPGHCGVAEFTTAFAQKMAKEAECVGVDGIMVMPALVYSSKPHETAAHFRSVATATDLPIMVYNNPPIYKNDVTPDIHGDAGRLRQHRLLQRLLRRYPPFYRLAQLRWRPLCAVRWAG